MGPYKFTVNGQILDGMDGGRYVGYMEAVQKKAELLKKGEYTRFALQRAEEILISDIHALNHIEITCNGNGFFIVPLTVLSVI